MKKLIKAGPFDARDYGDRIIVYPYKRDRFYTVTVRKPRESISLRTGRPFLEMGCVEWGHHNTKTLNQARRYAEAILVSVRLCEELNDMAWRLLK